MENIRFSIIIPLMNEQDNIEPLYLELNSALRKAAQGYEVIFIDDGSTDDSLAVIKRIQSKDKAVKVVSFKRNCGQTAAIAAGFDFAKGDILITMDADLQNDPSDIPRLVELIDRGYDVVSGWRKARKDNFLLRKLPSYLANKLISVVTKVILRDYGCTLKAYRKDIVKDIKLYGEMHRFLPALAVWAGAKVTEVEVGHRPRVKGRSKYGIGRTFKVLLDLITIKFLMNYSTKPNYVFGGMGIISLLFGLVSLAIVSYRIFVLKRMEATPLVFMMVIFFTVGVQFILMGLLAEVLVRTHFESQDKPVYLIREKINI